MKNHKLIPIVIGVAMLVALLPANTQAELSEAKAREHLQNGARVVDVRTVEEYKSKSLTNVVNIPLDVIKTKFPTIITNKSELVLLHCRTGRRSGLAETELRALGYTNVFNIGSFEKAQKILTGAAK
jgi:rhodanese-related sulfurtransferase